MFQPLTALMAGLVWIEVVDTPKENHERRKNPPKSGNSNYETNVRTSHLECSIFLYPVTFENV
jgi:hypothetical protein